MSSLVLIIHVVDCPFSIDDNESFYGTSLGTVGPYPDAIVLYSFKLGSLLAWVVRLHRGCFPGLPLHDGSRYQTTLCFRLWSFIHETKSKGNSVSVSFNVENSGNVDGTDIPQLYLAFPTSAGESK